MSRYRADLGFSLHEDAATFSGSGRFVFALLAAIAIGYPLVVSFVHGTMTGIAWQNADQIIFLPFFEDVYTESLVFMLASFVVGIFSPALGVLFILVFAPADLIAAQVAPIVELVPPPDLDIIIVPIAGRLISYALLWILAVEIPLLIRRYAIGWASRGGQEPSVPALAGASVAWTVVLVFLWTHAVPFLIQPVGTWTYSGIGGINVVARLQVIDYWPHFLGAAALAAAVAGVWPRPVRRRWDLDSARPVERSAARHLVGEIAWVLVLAALFAGLMTTVQTAVLLIGSLLVTGPVLNRTLPRLQALRIGPPPRTPARCVIAMTIVLALSFVALQLAPDDITDGYVVAAIILSVALPLFRVLLDAGAPDAGARGSARSLPPAATAAITFFVLGLALMLPTLVLANDKTTPDELLAWAKGAWDGFLGFLGFALGAVAAALMLPFFILGDALAPPPPRRPRGRPGRGGGVRA